MTKLWGGRFKKSMHPLLQCFSYSLAVDFELLEAELEVDEAWVKMLAKSRLISPRESARLVRALKALGRELKPKDPHAALDLKTLARYEDVHTLIQAKLESKVGALAKKIHTGRSRNDLVVTSTRVYLRKKRGSLLAGIQRLQKSLVRLAEKAGPAAIPGLTHLRKAQPVLLAHHLLAYVEMLEEDRQRLLDASKRIDILVLGSAALAGSALPLNQAFLAKALGFAKIAPNSMAAVSDRGFLTEFLAGLSILWVHLSRLSEDFILWNSEFFNYIELDDAFATGSSLMPQKKNPDVFELVRARSAVIFSHLQTLLGIQKGLALAYNRDLQEDKPALFDAVKKSQIALEILALTIESTSLKPEFMAQALQEDGLFAADLLEYLVRRGVAFSQAHETIGQAVRVAAEKGKSLSELSGWEWKKISLHFKEDMISFFNARTSLSGKRTIGSTHPERVKREIQKWRRILKM